MRNLYFLIRDESGLAKYVLFGALIVLLSSILNPWIFLLDLGVLLFFYPVFWILWILVRLRSSALIFRQAMNFAWIIVALAVLISLLTGAIFNNWTTGRQYVIMQDLTCLAFAPIVFPLGLIPELAGQAIELLPFVGDGAIHRWEISHGLYVFVFLTWAKYCVASLLEVWAILTVRDKARQAKP